MLLYCIFNVTVQILLDTWMCIIMLNANKIKLVHRFAFLAFLLLPWNSKKLILSPIGATVFYNDDFTGAFICEVYSIFDS